MKSPRSLVLVSGPSCWVAAALLGATRHAPIGVIEILLLAGPLLAVPLGLTVLRETSPSPADRVTRAIGRALLPAGGAMTLAFVVGPGATATVLTIPWLGLTLVLALQAVAHHLGRRPDAVRALRLVAVGWLPIAAGAATMTQAGVTALGITPELIRLTAVHLNFAGFGATVIAAQLLADARRRDRHRRAAGVAAALTVGGAMVVAIGHLTARVIELAGATSMTAGVILIGVVAWSAAPRRSAARVLLRISAGAVVGSMGFAVAYAWSLTVGADHLPYATIAATHGSLNAFGFTLCGLLGWLAIARHHRPDPRSTAAHASRPRGDAARRTHPALTVSTESASNRRPTAGAASTVTARVEGRTGLGHGARDRAASLATTVGPEPAPHRWRRRPLSRAGELFGRSRRRTPRPPDAAADRRVPVLEGISS